MGIAAILNGELRFVDHGHFDSFARSVSMFTLHIVTYPQYKELALQLACNVLITEPLALQNQSFHNLYQWHTLQLAMQAFHFGAETDAIIRIRTDATLPRRLPFPILPGRLYAFTDRVFLAERTTFTILFSDYLKQVATKYMTETYTSQETDVLRRMPLPGTTYDGGCVHPCERTLNRTCPPGFDMRTHVPWHYAPPQQCHKSAFLGSDFGFFCSEPSFGYHVYALNFTCEKLGHVELIHSHRSLTWGKGMPAPRNRNTLNLSCEHQAAVLRHW